MTFDHLSDGQFEEFVYDLVVELGFVNVDWRRGSGKGGATADQGRDVSATLRRVEVDGTEHYETWFFQCKRYERGVPPEALQGALSWASAERPAALVFAVSNFLSNPAKNYLEDYERNNRPAFRIKVWERKHLERLAAGRWELLTKHGLQSADPIRGVHPAHIEYATGPRLNTLEHLFATLDLLDPSDRDTLLEFAFFSVIRPRLRESRNEEETLGQRLIDPASYTEFRRKCYEIRRYVAEDFFVQSVVLWTLAWGWHLANPQSLQEQQRRHRDAIAYLTQERHDTEDESRRRTLDRMLAFMQRQLETVAERQGSALARYQKFCDLVLPRLFLEEPLQTVLKRDA